MTAAGWIAYFWINVLLVGLIYLVLKTGERK